MDLIYVDEQEGETDRGKYTAALAAIIRSENLHPFRSEYYSSAIEILGISPRGGKSRRLESVPLLHRADLLRDRTDFKKISMVDMLLSCFVRHGGSFVRLGYYNESFPAPTGDTRSKRMQLAITGLAIMFSKRLNPFCYIHELDLGEFRSGYRFLSEQLSLYYQIGPDNVSFDAHNYVGSFIAPKYDLGCQVADLSGYIAMKAERPESEFAQELATIYTRLQSNFILNDLIWLNDPKKSRQ